MRAADELPGTNRKILGERVIGELLDKSIALIPMAIGPHDKWGSLVDRLLHQLLIELLVLSSLSSSPHPGCVLSLVPRQLPLLHAFLA